MSAVWIPLDRISATRWTAPTGGRVLAIRIGGQDVPAEHWSAHGPRVEIGGALAAGAVEGLVEFPE